MQMMRIPGVGYLVVLLAATWLIQQVVTAFAGVLTLVWIVATAGVVIGLLHSFGLTSVIRKIPKGDKIMDLLDKFTMKSELIAQLGGESRVNHDPLVPIRMSLEDVEAMRKYLKRKVVGQNKTIDDVTATLRMRFAQVERKKPVATFLFAGPPGTGKTYLANLLGQYLDRPFQDFDMSTCSHESGATTLFGSPKGYAGSDTPGNLTKFLKRNPNGIVLLDEWEKAHTSVQTKFLTCFNDGYVTEASTGEQIATNQAIFIMTSNAAWKQLAEIMADANDNNVDQVNASVHDALIDAGIKPEIMSRIDQVFVFAVMRDLDQARVAITILEAVCEKYGKVLREGEDAIEPAILRDLMERARVLQAAGGVRSISRAVERDMADSILELPSATRSVRLRKGHGTKIIAEAA
ncbi:MAG: Clp protease [Methylobacterium sp.]|nr:MAG: Clp protease [Methylobacterium sp.]